GAVYGFVAGGLVAVDVGLAVFVGLAVAVGGGAVVVGTSDGGTSVMVTVGVGVAVTVTVGTGVGVSDGVTVTVGVGVAVTVTVGTGVGVSDGVADGSTAFCDRVGRARRSRELGSSPCVTVTVGTTTCWVAIGAGVGTVVRMGVAGGCDDQSFGSTIG